MIRGVKREPGPNPLLLEAANKARLAREVHERQQGIAAVIAAARAQAEAEALAFAVLAPPAEVITAEEPKSSEPPKKKQSKS